jgi:hypothetical protein
LLNEMLWVNPKRKVGSRAKRVLSAWPPFILL